MCLEVHDKCFQARDGLTASLDHGFLARVMELMELDADEQLDIIHKVDRVERWLHANKEKRGEG